MRCTHHIFHRSQTQSVTSPPATNRVPNTCLLDRASHWSSTAAGGFDERVRAYWETGEFDYLARAYARTLRETGLSVHRGVTGFSSRGIPPFTSAVGRRPDFPSRQR